jgi:GntR family transcriptional regulator
MCSQRFFKGHACLRVRDLLAQKIAAGEWDAGKELPSERVLARQFGVSCGTVRSALELLERECAIVRKRGDTFIAAGDSDHREIRVEPPQACGDSVPSEVESTPVTEGWSDETECVRLHLRSTDRVFRTCRVHFAMGVPFMAERTTLAAALFPGLADSAIPPHCILDLARMRGIALGAAHEQASIAAASAQAREILGVEEGSLVLVLDRVVTTRDGRPAEWRVAECNLTRQHLSAMSKGGGSVD